MKCSLCGNEIVNEIKIKDGNICQDCYDALPESIRNSLLKWSKAQLTQAKATYTNTGRASWASYGGLELLDTSIRLNKFEYQTQNLQNISINFHPRRLTADNKASGIITIVLETISPHILLEEPIFGDSQMQLIYHINRRNISYEYPEILRTLVKGIKSALKTEDKSLYKLKEKVTANSQHKQTYRNKSSNTNSKNKDAEYTGKNITVEDAMRMLDITGQFTKDDLKKTWKTKLKSDKIHPDDGGDEEEFKQYNAAYTLLQRYATGSN